MANWTRKQLEEHFNRARKNKWLPFFDQAAKAHNHPVEVLVAIASRETGMRNILGDSGHGHGIMQIDDRSFPKWTATEAWRDPEQAILKGAEVLAIQRRGIDRLIGREITYTTREKFTVPDLTDEEKLRIAIAAYNCGVVRALYHFSRGDVDGGTTQKDYSEDVLARAAIFRELLNKK